MRPKETITHNNFISRTDEYLRKNAPHIWDINIHYILPISILLTVIFFVCGYLFSLLSYENTSIIHPLEPICIWNSKSFLTLSMVSSLLFFYWFSLQRKTTKNTIGSLLLKSFIFITTLSFTTIITPISFELGILYEYKSNKIPKDDIKSVTNGYYYLFGQENYNYKKEPYKEKSLQCTLLSKRVKVLTQRILQTTFETGKNINKEHPLKTRNGKHLETYLETEYDISTLADTSYKKNLASHLPLRLSGFQDLSISSYDAIYDKIRKEFYTDANSKNNHSSDLEDLFPSSLININTNIQKRQPLSALDSLKKELYNYDQLIIKLYNDTNTLQIDSFNNIWNQIITNFKKDSANISKSPNYAVKNKLRFSKKSIVNDISEKINIYDYHIKYINYYYQEHESTLNKIFNDNYNTPKGSFKMESDNNHTKLIYKIPEKLINFNHKYLSHENASDFFNKNIPLKLFLRLFPFIIILSSILLSAPYINLDFFFFSSVSLLIIYAINLIFNLTDYHNLTVFQPIWIYFFIFIIGISTFLFSFYLKRYNRLTIFSLHSILISSIMLVVYSLFYLDLTLHDKTMIVESMDNTLIFPILSEVEIWGIAVASTITAFLAPLVFSQPKTS